MIGQGKAVVGVFSLLLCALVGHGGAQATVGAIDLRECVIYSAKEPAKRFDCLDRAREICNGKSLCELPIGLALSDGRDIDPRSGKKVRIRLRCGRRALVQGPHDQDEHATMILACPG